MMYGGGGAPPPPPDYTSEKRAIRQQVEGRYKNEADTYNTAVSEYNTNIGNIYDNARGLSDRVSQLSADDAGSVSLSDLKQERRDIADNFYSASFNETRPDFRSSFGSEYGPVGVPNIPTLNTVDNQTQTRLRNTLSNIRSDLSGLENQLGTEKNRISSFKSELAGDVARYGSKIGNLDVGDTAQANEIRANLQSLNNRRQSFSSPILEQELPGGFSSFDSSYDNLIGQLDTLNTDTQSEQTRIDDYRSDLRGFSDKVYDDLGNLSISDKDKIESYRNDIANEVRGLNRFDSQLGYDFSTTRNELSELDTQLNQLLLDRQSELDSIQSAESGYVGRARAIADNADNASFYNGSRISSIEDEIDRLRGDIDSNEFELEADFGRVDPLLTGAEEALSNLSSERTSELESISSQIPKATTDLSQIELSNEDAFVERQGRLSDLRSQLSQFSGSEVDAIEKQIDDGVSQIDGRLKELDEFRKDLTDRAETLVSSIDESSYFGLDDLSNDQQSVDSLRAEAELYDAQNALQEIGDAMERLNAERQRLEADKEAVGARRNEVRNQLESTLNEAGLPSFQNFSQQNPLSIDQYVKRFNMTPQEEEELRNIARNSAFSRALGVIKTGSGG